ncbi:MAG: alpha/beta fold hydrolase [Thermoplasmata archaeon]
MEEAYDVMVPLDVAELREEFQVPHELVTASDGKIIFVRHWIGSSGTDLAILIFHGITAYSEPYGKLLAEELAGAGFHVFGMDLRGHGRSDGIRGDLPSEERLSKDLCETVASLKAKFSRVVVLGHSLGVLSALIAVNRCPGSIDGLILLSAGRQIKPGAYSKPRARAVLKTLLGIALFPSRPLIEYNRKGMAGRNDPLFNFRYSARFYSAMYGMSPWAVVRMLRHNVIDSPNMTTSGTLEIPVLVGVGDQDELFSVDSSREVFDSIRGDRKEFLVVPGGHHASFPPGSWDRVVAWLRTQFPAAPGGTFSG